LPVAVRETLETASKSTPHRVNWGVTALSAALVTIAAVVRLVASWDNFWLDEIWSWRFAISAKSYWQVATGIPHDNNQILNTWAIYSFPPDAHWTVYRIPAVLAGVGAVVLAGLSGWKRSACEGITALVLTGSSFVFIQYSSEARGYAYLLLFVFLSVWLMQRIDRTSSRRDEFLFGISASFGFLAHFLFVAAYGGLIAWSLISVIRRHRRWTPRIGSLIWMHGLPFLTLAGLAICYGGMPMAGGGDHQRVLEIITQAGSLIVGGPNHGVAAVLCCCITAVASVIALVQLNKQADGVVYFVVGSTITLALMIIVAATDLVYPRHFLVPMACVLIVLSHLLATLWNAGRIGKGGYLVAVGLFLMGNTVHTWSLLKYGRGSYEEAVAFLQAESGDTVTLGSDHDFRNGMVLDYYYRRLLHPKPLAYYPGNQWPPEGPEWLILHSFEQPAVPQPIVQTPAGHRYQLVKVFPYYGLSGWNWILYRRATATAS
jgi:hypothetical protein